MSIPYTHLFRNDLVWIEKNFGLNSEYSVEILFIAILELIHYVRLAGVSIGWVFIFV